MKSVLFICTGNICRSPTGEGVFRQKVVEAGLANAFHIDSAGMIGYHVGEAPDHRAVQEAKRHGVDISGQRARKITRHDAADFDYIIAMDHGHMRQLRDEVPEHLHHKLHLMAAFLPDSDREVPDPYYGTLADFELAYNYIDEGCEALLAHIREL